MASMELSPETSQISEPSRIKIVAKYFVHGFVMFLALGVAGFAAWYFLALGGFLIGPIAVTIEYVIIGMILSVANADICHWLWDLEAQRTWPRLILQGIVLTVTIYIIQLLTATLSDMMLSSLPYRVYLLLALLFDAVLIIFEGYLFRAFGDRFL